MSTSTFLIVAAIVLLATALAGLMRRPQPGPAPPPAEEVKRWAVFRLRVDRLRGGEGPLVEGLPGGPVLFQEGSAGPGKTRIRLLGPDGKRLGLIQARRRFWRRVARIEIGRRLLAEIRGGRRGEILEEIRPQEMDFTLSGDAAALELEARRGGKLIATVSPDIAPSPGAVGIEILALEARVVVASVETYLKYAEAIGLTATASAPAA